MILADWHTHTEASPNASLRAEDLCAAAAAQGLTVIGMCDHCNWPDAQYRNVMRRSRAAYDRLRPQNPALRFGTELSPCPAGVCDALRAGKTLPRGRAGYLAPENGSFAPALALNAGEIAALELDYVVAGVHWRCDAPDASVPPDSTEKWIAEWLRCSVACAEGLSRIAGDRRKILAHPWYSCLTSPWYQTAGDTERRFALIPYSAHAELAAALVQYGVCAECNADQVTHPILDERYRREYAEFLRFLHESGVTITYGSDESAVYTDRRAAVEAALRQAGFQDGEIQ